MLTSQGGDLIHCSVDNRDVNPPSFFSTKKLDAICDVDYQMNLEEGASSTYWVMMETDGYSSLLLCDAHKMCMAMRIRLRWIGWAQGDNVSGFGHSIHSF